MSDDFETGQLFQTAVDDALEAGWSVERIQEELQVALERAFDTE